MQPDVLKNRIAAGRGDVCADLVLKNARVINVFTNEIETADIAISGNYIVGVGEYRGRHLNKQFCRMALPQLSQTHMKYRMLRGLMAWSLCWKQQKT